MEDEKLISEFNEAKFQIVRLHNIWLECKTLREGGNLIGWKWKLDTGRIELNEDARRLDKENKKGKKDGAEKKQETGYLKQLTDIDEAIEKAETSKDLREFYKQLKGKELLLREIQNAAGKGGRTKLSDDDGM